MQCYTIASIKTAMDFGYEICVGLIKSLSGLNVMRCLMRCGCWLKSEGDELERTWRGEARNLGWKGGFMNS